MIRFQLHCHTDASHDSKNKIEDVIKEAERKGINAIAITDHNVPFDMKRLKGIKTNVRVIPGIEANTVDDSDIIGLWVEKPIKVKGNLAVVRAIHKQGGLAVLAHPFRKWQGYMTPLIKRSKKEVEEFLSEIDAIEVYNAKTSPSENKDALEYFRDRGIPILAGSDAHTIKEIGNVVMKLDAPIKDIKKALLTAEREIVIDPIHRVSELASHHFRKIGRKALQVTGIKKGSARYKRLREKYLDSFVELKKKLGKK